MAIEETALTEAGAKPALKGGEPRPLPELRTLEESASIQSAEHGAPEVRRIDNLTNLQELRSVWEELLAKAEIRSPFQTFEWIESAWEAFGKHAELFVLVAYQQEQVVGIAPLMLKVGRANGVKERIVRFIDSDNNSSDYCGLIVPHNSKSIIVAFVHWLAQHQELWTQIDLFNLPTKCEQLEVLHQAFISAGLRCVRRRLYDAPAFILSNKEKDLKVTKKKSLVRYYNYFSRTGTLRFSQIASWEEAQKQLPLFFEQHQRRSASTGRPTVVATAAQRLFISKVARRFLDRGWLRFTTLSYHDQVIAYHFGFEFNGSLIWYLPTFDIVYGKRGPGQVLLKCVMEDAIKRGLSEVDFTVGGEGYKYRFANLIRSNSQLVVCKRLHTYCLAQSRLLLQRLKRWAISYATAGREELA